MSRCHSSWRSCASAGSRGLLSTLVLFALGVNFYPFFEVHYLGALTCLFVLVSVTGLQRLRLERSPHV